jgi:hypothetical protein
MMLAAACIALGQAGTAAAVLPWGRPTAPTWVEPEEVAPWSPGADVQPPRISIQLKFATAKSVASGSPEYKSYEPAYTVVGGKAKYTYPLINAYTGGKLEVYVYVAEVENVLYKTSGIKKSSVKTLIGTKWHGMAEFDSTKASAIEGRFVLYVELKAGKTFEVAAQAKDEAGNPVNTQDGVTYEVIVRTPPKAAAAEEEDDEEESKEAQPDPKKGKRGIYDPDAPPRMAEKEAWWWTCQSKRAEDSYPTRTLEVGYVENMERKNAAYDRWVASGGRQVDWNEYVSRGSREYSYFQQDGTHVATLSSSAYSPASGYP